MSVVSNESSGASSVPSGPPVALAAYVIRPRAPASARPRHGPPAAPGGVVPARHRHLGDGAQGARPAGRAVLRPGHLGHAREAGDVDGQTAVRHGEVVVVVVQADLDRGGGTACLQILLVRCGDPQLVGLRGGRRRRQAGQQDSGGREGSGAEADQGVDGDGSHGSPVSGHVVLPPGHEMPGHHKTIKEHTGLYRVPLRCERVAGGVRRLRRPGAKPSAKPGGCGPAALSNRPHRPNSCGDPERRARLAQHLGLGRGDVPVRTGDHEAGLDDRLGLHRLLRRLGDLLQGIGPALREVEHQLVDVLVEPLPQLLRGKFCRTSFCRIRLSTCCRSAGRRSRRRPRPARTSPYSRPVRPALQLGLERPQMGLEQPHQLLLRAAAAPAPGCRPPAVPPEACPAPCDCCCSPLACSLMRSHMAMPATSSIGSMVRAPRAAPCNGRL